LCRQGFVAKEAAPPAHNRPRFIVKHRRILIAGAVPIGIAMDIAART
jgi:hypothetical protein